VAVPVFAFVLHVVVWRRRLMPLSVVSLLLLFAGSAVALGALALLGAFPRPEDGVGWARALLAALGVWGVYLSTYCAVADDSPSAAILVRVERAGPEGTPIEDLRATWGADDEIIVRLADLRQAGWVSCSRGSYRLSPRGRVFLALVRALRRPLTSAPMQG
jgi:hypothetical protein